VTLAVEPIEIVYEPRGAALQLWRCKDPEILIEGPAGTGKTRGILEKILAMADKYPGSRHLLCRKTRASMTESVLVTFEEKVLPPGSPIADGPQRTQRHAYTLPNGSSLVIGGLDKPGRTFSTEYDTVTVFEAFETTENDWESLHRALRNGRMGYHQAIADTNPWSQGHWLNQRAASGRMTRLLSRHEDNPQFWDAEAGDWTPAGRQYIARLDALTGHRKQRLRYGRWANAEGVVYDFDPQVHLVNKFEPPADWRRIRSIDFGLVNPFVCQWWAIDHDGRMYLYREIYRTQRLVKGPDGHAAAINRLSEGERYEVTVSDHDTDDRDTLLQAGIPTAGAFKAVVPGIQAVAQRINLASDKKPRLFVMRDCRVDADETLREAKLPTCTAEEFDGYVYAEGVDGKARKEEPVKVNDHGMDAMRYAVAYVDGIAGVRLSFDDADADAVGATAV